MKELGEYLKETRKKNSVTINEASEDLNLTVYDIENIEIGNVKAFKDVFELKEIVRSYAKYLGLNSEKVLDEFNDFIFEKTSKISIEDIKNAKKKISNKEENENKIKSPYTKYKQSKYDLAPIVLAITVVLFISLLVYLILRIADTEKGRNIELSKGVKKYEFTEQTNYY